MFASRSVPMAHQTEAVRRALRKKLAFAHRAETGTGKSAMILYEWQLRFDIGELRDLLIIAPAGCIKNWYEGKGDEQLSELETHLDPRLFKNMLIATNRKKAAHRDARARMLGAKEGTPRALFVNIEAFSRGKDTEAELLCRQFLSSNKAMMVIDESTTIRHHRSARSRAVLRLAPLAKARRILTGLITPRSPLDLYNQMNFLDYRILNQPSYTAFRARYAKMRVMNAPAEPIVDMRLRQMCNRKKMPHPDTADWTVAAKCEFIINNGGYVEGQPLIVSYQNLQELKDLCEPYSFSVLKKDCLDLKPKIYEPRDIELTKEQAHAYQEMKYQALTELKDGSLATAVNVLAQMQRLHQIVCGHVKTEDGKIVDVRSHRVDTILEILEEFDGKAVIWVTYDHELRKLARSLEVEFGKGSVACYWGGNRSTRDVEERRFLNDAHCRFMISTPQTGGRGNTWNVATLAIYAANSYDLEHRYQSEDRNHRKGQKESVTYIDLIARGTVEEKIVQALRKKLDLAQIITGANYENWLV